MRHDLLLCSDIVPDNFAEVARVSVYLRDMQVPLNNPELQAKIEQWVLETGRPAEELVEDIVAGYFDEAARVRETLDSRYDEVKSGKVSLLDGEEFFENLRKREEELLKHPVGQ